jgi:hypothetical protein
MLILGWHTIRYSETLSQCPSREYTAETVVVAWEEARVAVDSVAVVRAVGVAAETVTQFH